jgi:hypothetical protein
MAPLVASLLPALAAARPLTAPSQPSSGLVFDRPGWSTFRPALTPAFPQPMESRSRRPVGAVGSKRAPVRTRRPSLAKGEPLGPAKNPVKAVCSAPHVRTRRQGDYPQSDTRASPRSLSTAGLSTWQQASRRRVPDCPRPIAAGRRRASARAQTTTAAISLLMRWIVVRHLRPNRADGRRSIIVIVRVLWFENKQSDCGTPAPPAA